MPINYQLGKIYKIVSDQTENVYIGSTCEPTLARRMTGHRKDYKQYINTGKKYITSYELLKYDDSQIILIENWPCDNKDELHKRERYWIDQYNNHVNKIIPTRTGKEYKKDNETRIKEIKKEYYESNKYDILKQCKEYKQSHKAKIKEREKRYREANKDDISKRIKDHYENNKTSILKRHKEYKQLNKEKINKQRKQYRRNKIIKRINEQFNKMKEQIKLHENKCNEIRTL